LNLKQRKGKPSSIRNCRKGNVTCIWKRNEKETYSYYETGEEREDVVGEMYVKFREKNSEEGKV
jgi:hypothetical protein